MNKGWLGDYRSIREKIDDGYRVSRGKEHRDLESTRNVNKMPHAPILYSHQAFII